MRTHRGFTLIELLVVVALIALLLAILVPGLQTAREKAKESVCGSTLRGLSVGIQEYIVENRDFFPLYAHETKGYGSLGPSTVYAAVLRRGKYIGPTWCPNVAEGYAQGEPEDQLWIREIKESPRRLGYAYNPQLGWLYQDPSQDWEFIYYDAETEGMLECYRLPGRQSTDLKRPEEFGVMGCGGVPYADRKWPDSKGIWRSYPGVWSLHGKYHWFKIRPLRPMSGPRERSNIMFADGHVAPVDDPQDYIRYESMWLWPGTY